MRPARNETDVRAGARKLHAEISADRAGAIDADLHRGLLGVKCWRAGLERSLKVSSISLTVNAASSGGGLRRAARGFIEGGRDVAHADDAGERKIVDHRKVPDVMHI